MSTPLSTPVASSSRRMALAGTLLAGGIAVGSLFSPMAIAGAQDGADTSLESATDGTVTDGAQSVAEHPNHERRVARRLAVRESLQEILGMSADELQAAREGGGTLVSIAADQGISETELVSALVSEATTRIAEAVEAGNLDADRADRITENLEERITDRVNRVPGERGGDRDGRGVRGGGGGPADADPDA